MPCDCIRAVNEQLAKRTTKLDLAFGIHPETMDVACSVSIAVMKIDIKSRTKPPRLTAPFCPFCGVKA